MTRDQLRRKWSDCARYGGIGADDSQMLRLLDAPLQTPASDLLKPICATFMSASQNSDQTETV